MSIIIDPKNALCNRLRALDSGFSLAEDCGRDLVIYWNSYNGMNCPIERLFQIPAQVRDVWVWSSISRISRLEKLVRLAAIRRKFSDDGETKNKISSYSEEELLKIAKINSRIFISTFARFYSSKTRAPYWWLEPREPLMAAAQKVVNKFFSGKRILGVHVRMWDNIKARQTSSLPKFIAAMEKELATDRNTMFFVATDDQSVEQELTDRFSSNILVYSKRSRDRSVPEACEDAMVDLICLKNTSKILGSYWSSFSFTAAEWGNIPLEVIS